MRWRMPPENWCGIRLERAFRIRQPDPAEHVEDESAAAGRVELAVERQAFFELAADRHRRVQRGHRLLEDHADLGAAHRPQALWRHGGDLFTVEADRARESGHGGWHETHHGACGKRLAGAGFADDADDLAARDGEADLFHDLAAGRFDGECEVLDLQQSSAHREPRMRGSSRSRTASPSRLMPSSVSEMHRPGKMPSHIAWPI